MACLLLLCSTSTHLLQLNHNKMNSNTENKIQINNSNKKKSSFRRRFAPSFVLSRRSFARLEASRDGGGGNATESSGGVMSRRALQAVLWGAEAVYIIWLFLLPFAPGDPVWAIKTSTISDLVGLSLNFFFVLPFLNFVGIHALESPVIHPMAEGLFNFVIGWTVLFAPLLYTDHLRDRFKGSLDLLWGLQMFLTNTFLIPYMAIRLNKQDRPSPPPKQTKLGLFMVSNASTVGILGGAVCVLSILWALFARGNTGFGELKDRLEYLKSYIYSERLAYAFIWDIVLYAIFQPWLIGDNIGNVRTDHKRTVSSLKFIPVAGMVAYLLSLNNNE